MEAVAPSSSLSPTPTKGKGVPLKTSGDDPTYNHWIDLIGEHAGPITLTEVTRAQENAIFPIIYCINNKDVNNDDNWAPCILRKIRKEQYEVLDTNEHDKLEEDLDWGVRMVFIKCD